MLHEQFDSILATMKVRASGMVNGQKDRFTEIEDQYKRILHKYPGSVSRQGNRKSKMLMAQIEESKNEEEGSAGEGDNEEGAFHEYTNVEDYTQGMEAQVNRQAREAAMQKLEGVSQEWERRAKESEEKVEDQRKRAGRPEDELEQIIS